jgi:3-hydroxyisobutyrate dehydrogenase-like beta-hydroxyacid dehydrogenase
MRFLAFTAAFTASMMLKDVDLGHALVVGASVETPLLEHTRTTLNDLVAAGLGDLDIASPVGHLAAINGIQLASQ